MKISGAGLSITAAPSQPFSSPSACAGLPVTSGTASKHRQHLAGEQVDGVDLHGGEIRHGMPVGGIQQLPDALRPPVAEGVARHEAPGKSAGQTGSLAFTSRPVGGATLCGS